MNVDMINSFINATVNALTTMAMLTVTRGSPYIKTTDENEFNRDISAIIGMAGDANGWVAFCLQRQLAVKIAANMLGEEKQEIDADVRDAVGEIVNMIAGGAKGELTQRGFSFKIALPTVVIGDNHELSRVKDFPYIVIPFATEEGNFTVEVCLKTNKI
ncbi:MAG: chemotaxis protein CheX [Candidatus Omnitrophica bacterium]|nr:chemotaxis protein CheX [Candidatus Omnitrophota bacterium]